MTLANPPNDSVYAIYAWTIPGPDLLLAVASFEGRVLLQIPSELVGGWDLSPDEEGGDASSVFVEAHTSDRMSKVCASTAPPTSITLWTAVSDGPCRLA